MSEASPQHPVAGGSGSAPPDVSTAELQLRVAALARANAQERRGLAHKGRQITELRLKVAQAQQQLETEEEKIGNALFRRLDLMRRDTHRMAETIKAEEERHSRVLHDIADVRSTKLELEGRIEAERDVMVNELHRRLLALSRDIANLEGQLHVQRGDFLTQIHAAVERLVVREPLDGGEPGAGGPTQGTVAALEADLRLMLHEAREEEAARVPIEEEAQRLEATLATERREAFLASARAAKLREELETASADLAFERQLDLKDAPVPPSAPDPCASTSALTASGNCRLTPRRRSGGAASGPGPALSVASVSSVDGESAASSSYATPLCHTVAPCVWVPHSAAQVRAHTAAVLSGAASSPGHNCPGPQSKTS